MHCTERKVYWCTLILSYTQAVPGQVWMILDAGGGTVDVAMHQIEASKTHPGESQLSERLRSRCLLLGSSMLDVQAEVNLLLPLFGSEAAYVQWKSEDPQSYISQVCGGGGARGGGGGGGDRWRQSASGGMDD